MGVLWGRSDLRAGALMRFILAPLPSSCHVGGVFAAVIVCRYAGEVSFTFWMHVIGAKGRACTNSLLVKGLRLGSLKSFVFIFSNRVANAVMSMSSLTMTMPPSTTASITMASMTMTETSMPFSTSDSSMSNMSMGGMSMDGGSSCKISVSPRFDTARHEPY